MATTREQFIALRKSGMTPVQAREEVMKTVTPVSKAPIVPTPVPTAPVVAPLNTSPESATKSTNLAQREANIASRQASPVAPVAPIVQTPVETPTTVAPVANATTTPNGSTMNADGNVTPAKVDATPGITQDSFQQAKIESEKIKAQNDAVMAQNKQKSDLAREDAAIAAQASIPTDQKGIVKSLISGVSVAPQKTQAYRNAVTQANEYKKFAGMTSTQLLDNLKQGQIGSEMMGLLAQNPQFAKAKAEQEKIQKTDSINRATQFATNAFNGKETPVKDELAGIEAKYSAPAGTNVQAYEQYVTQNEDVRTAGLQVKALAKNIADVTTTYNQALKDLKSQYPDMPASAMLTLMGSRTGETKSLLDSYINAQTIAKGDFDMAMKMAEGSYGAYEKDRAEYNQIEREQRQVQAQKDMIQYEADFTKKQAEAALADPQTQIGATMKEFADMGIVAQGNTASKIAEFQTSGKTLPEYISGLRKQFMSKPEYQKIQELKSGQLSDAQKFRMQNEVEDRRDLRNFAQQKELARMNGDIAREKFLFEIENDPEKKAKALAMQTSLSSNKSLFDVLGKNVGTYEGNRGYDLAGALGDPLPAGGNWTVKSVGTAGEQVGSIFIGGKGQKPYGNTVVMVDESGNEIRYSHLQNIGVKPGDVLGFGDIVGTRGNTGNVKGANGETLTAEQLKAGRGAHVDIEIKNPSGKLLSNADQVTFLKGLKSGGAGQYSESEIELLSELSQMEGSARNTALKAQGIPLQAVTDYKAASASGKIPPTEGQKQAAIGILSNIQGLAQTDWNDAVGKFDYGRILGLQDASDTSVLIENLRDASAFNNLGMIKGPMSDKDIAFLKSVSSKLDPVQSNAQFEKNIVEMYNIAARKAGLSEIKKLSEIPKERIMAGQQPNTAPATYTSESQSIENEWLNRK